VVVPVVSELPCNDHCLCSESLGVRRQVRWGGYNVARVRERMDRFQCIWVAMIGEMHKSIAEYLGNGFR